MILLADSEGPDVQAEADLGLCCLQMPQNTFSHGASWLQKTSLKCSEAV